MSQPDPPGSGGLTPTGFFSNCRGGTWLGSAGNPAPCCCWLGGDLRPGWAAALTAGGVSSTGEELLTTVKAQSFNKAQTVCKACSVPLT